MIGESLLKTWLAHPRTRGLNIDDPRTTYLRRQIIQEKQFLRRIYQEWYVAICASLPPIAGPVLELGSGAGFLSEALPDVITSDLFACRGIQAVLDGQRLPLADRTLRAIVMTNVLHHVPDVRCFLREAARCIRPGGVIVMLEPWVTVWSRLVYTRLHHEPFQPMAAAWEFPSHGPLSDANGALPWIVFERDRSIFEREFTEWHISVIKPVMPFRYLLSGGVSLRNLMPYWSFEQWQRIEHWLEPWMSTWAMFAQIVLTRQ